MLLTRVGPGLVPAGTPAKEDTLIFICLELFLCIEKLDTLDKNVKREHKVPLMQDKFINVKLSFPVLLIVNTEEFIEAKGIV